MIVLPLKIEDNMVSLKLSFKELQCRKNVLQADKFTLSASNISLGKVNLKSHAYSEKYDIQMDKVAHFLRRNVAFKKNENTMFITTKNYHQEDFYDVYKLPLYVYDQNHFIDTLYGLLINDLRLMVPNTEKGKEISFKALGFDDYFNSDVLETINIIKSASADGETFFANLQQHGFSNQLQILDFLDKIQFDVVEESVLPKKEFDEVTSAFYAIHGPESKVLQKYEQKASENEKSFKMLSSLYHNVYGKPLLWSNLEEKVKKLEKKS